MKTQMVPPGRNLRRLSRGGFGLARSLALALAMLVWTAGPAGVAQAQDQRIPPRPGAGGYLPTVDPTTGLPLPDPGSQWKDPKWKDPDKILAQVVYDGIPVGEVVRDLRQQFSEAFDFVIPTTWHAPAAIVPEFSDPSSVPIKIQLKNVTLSEVFNALNLVFETENTPLQWELKMNGSRPTVILRVMPNSEALFRAAGEPPKRRIFFVGEMVGNEKSGGTTLEQLVRTISEVYEMSHGPSQGPISSHLQYHKDAQLLIATGTVDEINFISEILAALRQKSDFNHPSRFGGGGGNGRGQGGGAGKGGEGSGGSGKNEPKEDNEKAKAP